MYPLSNFTSVFEVATALCLGYGLLRDVYEFPLATIERRLVNSKAVLRELGHDQQNSGLESAITLVERIYSLEKPKLEKVYIRLARISVFLSVLPISLMIVAGFCSVQFSIVSVIVLLSATLLIVPLLAAIAFYRTTLTRKRMAIFLAILDKELFDVLFVSQSQSTTSKAA